MSASAVDLSRRLLLGASGALVAGAAAAQGAAGGQGAGQGAGGQGGGSGGQPPKAAPPRIPNRLTARPDPQLEDEPPLSEDQKVGFAVVGIGKFALEQAIPAFGETKAAKLVGLVSGDPAKGARVARQHGIAPSRVWSYDSFDRIAADPAVQVVYIMTPNSLHADLAVRAFRAGKHVLCEKPMAVTEADCERMIRAAADASRKLMIAYRAQFEPHNLEAVRRIRAGEVGAVRLITSVHGRQLDVRDPADQWRAQAALAGGGSLYDIGIYALNGARYLTGEEPESVTAQISNAPNDPRFAEVEDLIKFQLRFPSGAETRLAGHQADRGAGRKGRADAGPGHRLRRQPAALQDGGRRAGGAGRRGQPVRRGDRPHGPCGDHRPAGEDAG